MNSDLLDPVTSPAAAAAAEAGVSATPVRSPEGTGPSRVLLITNIPTPYRIPLFNELNTQLAREGIGLKVVFAALGYPRRKWNIDMTQCAFKWEVLNSGRVPSRDPESAVFTYSGLGRILRAEPNALVIVSGFSLASMRLWLQSFFRRTPYLIWSGAIEQAERPDSRLRRWQRRLLISRARGFVAYGTGAKEYLASLGADSARVAIAINTVDTEFFRVASEREARARSAQDRIKELIFVGELSPRKRVDLLLAAIAYLAERRNDFVLRVLGTGSEGANLREMAHKLGIDKLVAFEGLKQRGEIAEALGRADCFLFPTGFDIWGLVLVEAMAAGLTCLSSTRAAATRDLVRHGETGFAVDFSESRKVADLLGQLLDRPEEIRRIGLAASRFVAQEVSLARSAAGFVEAIRRSMARN